jgi:hypothetical protein
MHPFDSRLCGALPLSEYPWIGGDSGYWYFYQLLFLLLTA